MCWNLWGKFQGEWRRYIVQMDDNNKNSIAELFVNILHKFYSSSMK